MLYALHQVVILHLGVSYVSDLGRNIIIVGLVQEAKLFKIILVCLSFYFVHVLFFKNTQTVKKLLC